MLPDSAKKVSTHSATVFRQYMRRNHDKWHEFASHVLTLDCRPEDIILVRGTVKTSAWALAAYTDAEVRATDISFSGKAGSIATAGFQWSSARSSSAEFEQRVGPSNKGKGSIRAARSGKSVARYKELPEIEYEKERGLASSSDDENVKDQCVFLGHYKIKHRFLLPKKIYAAAGDDEHSPSEDPAQSPAVVVADADIEAVPATPKVCYSPLTRYGYASQALCTVPHCCR